MFAASVVGVANPWSQARSGGFSGILTRRVHVQDLFIVAHLQLRARGRPNRPAWGYSDMEHHMVATTIGVSPSSPG